MGGDGTVSEGSSSCSKPAGKKQEHSTDQTHILRRTDHVVVLPDLVDVKSIFATHPFDPDLVD